MESRHLSDKPPRDGVTEVVSIADRSRAIIASFNLSERILYALSKDPATAFRGGYGEAIGSQWSESNALSPLQREYPDFRDIIQGQRILDYGCGDGFQSIAMAKCGATEVLGVDIQAARLGHARRMAEGLTNVSFATTIPDGRFDMAVSLNAFEHFPNPAQNLAELSTAVRPGGRILITFGPPWMAPYGSHTHFFTRCPWVNLLFSERTVHRVRALYRTDDLMTYAPDLNKMTVARFERLIQRSGLLVLRRRYSPAWGVPLVASIPGVRELFVNHITCSLRKP